mmetsp:Transcript_21794/g.40084  ORF Transcript_21794/g.40084 Transcript_21794/m.40084 type:complete len:676 (-) Transcript_21794:66-2093(-)
MAVTSSAHKSGGEDEAKPPQFHGSPPPCFQQRMPSNRGSPASNHVMASPMMIAATPPPGLEHMATPLQAGALALSPATNPAALLAALSPMPPQARSRLNSGQLDEEGPCMGNPIRMQHLELPAGIQESADPSGVLGQSPGGGHSACSRMAASGKGARNGDSVGFAVGEPRQNAGLTCCMCKQTSVDDPSAPERFFIDGRLVCEGCRPYFTDATSTDGRFEPKYVVCINPLCRRKWKQLTPKALPLFCPTCKRQLEDSIQAPGQCESDGMLLEEMYERWRTVVEEIADIVGYPAPPPRSQSTAQDGGQMLEWQEILAAFEALFPQPPDAKDVRNWNSVHGRRKHYRGEIRRLGRRFVVSIDATQELGPDLTVSRPIQPGSKSFQVLDWLESLEEGQEVDFVAFPNPSVSEREQVSRIVRLLDVTSRTEQGGSIDAKAEDEGSPRGPFARLDDGGAGGGFVDTFADLMEWTISDGTACQAEWAVSDGAGQAESNVDVVETPAPLPEERQVSAGTPNPPPVQSAPVAAPTAAISLAAGLNPAGFNQLEVANQAAAFFAAAQARAPFGPPPAAALMGIAGGMPPPPRNLRPMYFQGYGDMLRMQPPVRGPPTYSPHLAAPPSVGPPPLGSPYSPDVRASLQAQTGYARGRPAPFPSPFLGARSPLMHPRSPCAVYFGES